MTIKDLYPTMATGPGKNFNGKRPEEQAARQVLLAAAIALFAQKGYAGTSVREIVERAGVTKPVLYYYFKNKEGIFRAILEWAGKLQEEMLGQVLDRAGSALDRFIHLWRSVYMGVTEYQDLFNMIYNLIFGPPEGAPAYDFEQFQKEMVETIKAIYVDGLANGEVKEANPDEVACIILSLMDYSLHLDRVHPESIDPQRPERLMRLAFRGLARDKLIRMEEAGFNGDV